jgi:tetratricopeptide (TPR) repeat protein
MTASTRRCATYTSRMLKTTAPLLCICTLLALPASSAAQRPEADMCAVPPGAQPLLPAKLLTGMGETNMPVTTKSEEARKFFNQGISQMHSFWFIESERSFLQAAALDPDMAMAYWGISVSAAGDYRPAFQLIRDPYDGGRNSLSPPATDAIQRTANGAAVNGRVRARESIEKAMGLRDKVTPRERMYIEAEWARRNPASKTNDADHIAALRKLVAAYPDDEEAKSILGLALLDGFDSVTKEPRTNTMEGLRLLTQVAEANDGHFGAHHYLIHGWEGSKTPEKAWHACKRYPELVPNIPHALHMPGHIYAQSDKIDEAIAAFSDAAANELSYLKADVLYPNFHHAHNTHFLVHALNLDGRFNDSMDRVRHMLTFKETPRERTGASQRTAYRQGYYALVKTLVRFERWDLILDGTTIPVYDKPEQHAWRLWATGLAHAAQGRVGDARAAHGKMKEQLKNITASKRPLEIAGLELEATVAARGGATKRGWELFRKAGDMEAALIYTEPPSYPRPVVEGWAHTALAMGDSAAAEKAYREALSREPGSGRAYFGLAAALLGQQKTAEAQEMMAKGIKAWDKADPDLPQLRATTHTAGGR